MDIPIESKNIKALTAKMAKKHKLLLKKASILEPKEKPLLSIVIEASPSPTLITVNPPKKPIIITMPIIMKRPFSTPNLNIGGREIEIITDPINMVIVTESKLSINGILPINAFTSNEIILPKPIKIRAIMYLPITNVFLDTGMVNAYLAKPARSSKDNAVIGSIAQKIIITPVKKALFSVTIEMKKYTLKNKSIGSICFFKLKKSFNIKPLILFPPNTIK